MRKLLLNIGIYLIKQLEDMDKWARRRRVRKYLNSQEDDVFILLCRVKPKGVFCISIYDVMDNKPECFYDAVEMIYDQARLHPYTIGTYVSPTLVEKAVLLWEGDEEIEQLGSECGFYLPEAI